MLLRLHDCGQKIECFRFQTWTNIRDIEKDPEHAFNRYHGEKQDYC